MMKSSFRKDSLHLQCSGVGMDDAFSRLRRLLPSEDFTAFMGRWRR